MKIKFRGQIWRTGNSHVVTIPIALIESGTIPQDQEIEFSIETKER